ncbi:heparin lyase I family protein [Aquimarina sp. W85]|uniref:heparin lyase I family protein n=1 Tax=Aquimarina rhodophyticola TaxID=3342246 RepID=UPI00366BCB7D
MKKILNSLLLLLSINITFSQTSEIYLQTFENDAFYMENRSLLGVSRQRDTTICFQSTITQEAKGYSWDLSNKHTSIGKSLKLTVHKNDHPQMACFPRSRSEVAFNLENKNHKTYFYSWEVFIPSDQEFIEESAGWHIITQILNNKYLNGIPSATERKILTMSYAHNPELPNSSARNLGMILYNSNTINERYARVEISDAIKKGQWNEFIFKLNWSEKEKIGNNQDYGFLQIWINRNPIVIDQKITYGGENFPTYKCSIGNTNDQAGKLESPNIAFTNNNTPPEPVSNSIKFGHYRSGLTNDHSIYIDNFRITEEFPPQQNKTKLIVEDCDSILFANDMSIRCYEIPNATSYIFQFEHNGNKQYVGNGNPTILNLNNVDFLQRGITYNVKVRSQGNGFSYDYGDSCQITISHKTKLLPEYCNSNILIDEMILQCYEILNATSYIFQFEHNGNKQYVGNGNSTILNLNNVGFLQPGITYNVKVRSQGDNFSFDYGETCQITIPSKTKIAEEYCNTTIPINQMTIECYKIPNATNYIFQFEHDGDKQYVGNGSSTILNLNNVSFLNWGTTYSVKARSQGDNFSFDYGTSCQITIPNIPFILSKQNNSKKQQTDLDRPSVYPNPFSTNLNINYNNFNLNTYQIYNINGSLVAEGNVKNKILNLDFIPRGLYFIYLNTTEKSFSYKIIKK